MVPKAHGFSIGLGTAAPFLALFALVFAPAGAWGQPTISWITGDGFWDVATNWRDSRGVARVPNSGDDVTVGGGTITIRTVASVHSISGSAPLVLTGTLTIAAASQLTGGISLDTDPFRNPGTLILNGPLTIAGNSTCQNGAIAGSGGLTNTGTLTLSGTATKVLATTLNNLGTIVHQAGTLEFGEFIAFVGTFAGILNNSGLYDAQVDVTLVPGPSATGAINNTGTFRKSRGTGTLTVQFVPFNNNSGTVDVESGAISLTGGTHSGGTFSAGINNNTAATLQFTGTHTFTGAYSGAGKGLVQLMGDRFIAGTAGASLNFPPGLLQWTNGIIDGGTGGWANMGTLTDAQNGTTIIIRNRFDNGGMLVISGVSAMDIDGCGSFTNLPGAVLDFQGDGGVFDASSCGGTHSLVNQGTVRKSIGTLSNISVSGFNNTASGAIDVRAGTLALTNSQNTGGAFTVAAGAALDLTGATVPGGPQGCVATYSGAYTGSGQGTVLLAGCFLAIGQAGATFNFPPGLFQWTGGEIRSGANGLTNTGAITLSGPGTKYLGGVLSNTGTIAHQAGMLQLDAGLCYQCLDVGTLNNSGLYDVRADVQITRQFLDGDIFNNTGIFRKSGGTSTTLISAPFNNTGTVEARTGSLNMFTLQIDRNLAIGNTLTAGTWHVFSNATLDFVNGQISLATTAAVNNATVVLDGPGAAFPPITPLNSNSGSLSLLNGSGFTTVGSLTNSGSIILGAGSKLSVAGTYSQTAAASLMTQISGRPPTGQFGQFSSSGNAMLAGALNVTLGSGFGLTSGDSYTVMSFPGHTGSFAAIGGTNLGLQPNLTNTALTLTAVGTQPNLSPTAVSLVTPTAQPGQQVTVNYAVRNLGGSTATGGWDDSIYLSASPFVTPDAVLLGAVHHTGDVAPQSSYNGTLTASLPPMLPGVYRVLVVADSHNVIPDSNRSNNTLASTDTLTVSIPLLSLGTPLSGKIANSQELYYHFLVTPGANITLSATYAIAQEAELYIRSAGLPTRTTFDLSTLSDLSNTNPKLAVNSTQGGDYYILLHGLGGAGAGQTFTLLAVAAQFQITSVSPEAGLNTESSQPILITGTEFTPQTTVSLVAAGGTAFAAASVSFAESTSLTATFDLTHIPLGSYTVRATSGNQTATAPELFQVSDIANFGNAASAVILSPASVRVGAKIGVSVELHGIGNLVTPVPLVEVDATNVKAGSERQQLADPAMPLFFQDKIQFSLSYDPQPHAAGVESGFNLSLISLETTIDWDSQKGSLRPPGIAADAWDAIWANLRPKLGGTVGSYYSLLGQDEFALAANGISTNRINRLFQFEIAMANGQSPVGVLGSTVDLAFPAPGLPFQFGRTFLGSSIAGRYRLGRLGRGWVDNLDVSASVDTVTKGVTIQQGPLNRTFSPKDDGTYIGQPGDAGTLSQSGGVFQLREKNGFLTVFRADGPLDYIQGPNGNRLTAGYTGALLTSLTHSNGSALTLSYNAQGRIQKVSDPAGRTAAYTYDASSQQLLNVTTAAGTVSYSYTAGTTGPQAFALASVTAPPGTHAFYEYDSQGRLQKTQRDSGAETVTYSYATASARITDADGRAATLLFDDSGRIVRTLDALGHQDTAQFDDNDNLTAALPQGGGSASFTYDSQDNLTGATSPSGASETLAYDPVFNQLTAATDALGHITSFSLDANGNTASAKYANGSREQYSYDAQGNLVSAVDRNGKMTQFTLDKRGLITSAQHADGSQTGYTYDANANLMSATNAQGAITMQYDAADRLTRISYPKGRFLGYSYDSGGRLAQMSDQAGFIVNYHYDQAGRLLSLTDAKGASIVSYTYEAAGQVSRVSNGNGTYTTFEYDGDGRLIHLVHYAPSNSVNSRFDYTYDVLGRRDTVTTLDGKTTFAYDADSRLTSVTLPGGRIITYVYDAAGNRIGTTDNGSPTAYTANNLNEYLAIGATTESYDAAGNLLNVSGTAGASYGYDSQDRLISVTGAQGNYSYEYDALGHRGAIVRNGQRTEFVIDPAGNAVGQYDATGQVVAHFTYGLGLASRVDAGGAAAWYDFDAIGSTTGLTGPAGQYISRYAYLPFGEALSVVESVPNPFRYVGAFGVQDDQNGLNFMRVRFYGATQGRFTQPDPIGLGGGPNLYAYAANNPVSFADPSGLQGPGINPLASSAPGIDVFGPTLNVNPYGSTGISPQLGAENQRIMQFAELFPYGNPYTGEIVAPEAPVPPAPAPGPGYYPSSNPDRFANRVGENGGVSEAEYWAELDRGFAELNARANRAAEAREVVLLGGLIILQNLHAGKVFALTGDLPPCLPFLPEEVQTCGHIPTISSVPAGFSKTKQVAPGDPNYLSGPGGFGSNNLIPGNATLPYIIGFQNEPKATAPAQQVVISQTLDPNLDSSTFQLGDFGFADFNVHVPDGRQSYSTRIDARSSRGVFVDVTAALTGNVVTWTLTSIDPATQKPPTDVETGFLPPDNMPPNGEGYVTYFVRPFAGLTPGTQIKAQAGVVFDTNGSVPTNLFINTIAPSAIQCTGCYFLVNGVRATLAFNVNAAAGTGTFTYNYRTATQTVQFTGTTISQIAVNGKTVTFAGQGSLNGQTSYSFQVTATDGGGPGSGQDSVALTITGPNHYSYSAGGPIVGGDIVINP